MVHYDADELGRLGQNEFQNLCTRERLIANPPHEDRTGWDFRVEHPNANLNGAAQLDLQSNPEPVMVQIKTVLSTTDKITLKLRTFQRLAKLTEPAFIIIPVFNEENRTFEIFAIHLINDALESLLHRLVEISETNETIPVDATISFSRKKWWRHVDMEKSNPLTRFFKEEIDTFCRQQHYATRKLEQLSNLGYEDGCTGGIDVTIQAENEEELYEGFLGLRPLHFSEIQAFDKRFDFKRPTDLIPNSPGVLEVSPTEYNVGILRVEKIEDNTSLDVPCNWASLPFLPENLEDVRLVVIINTLKIYLNLSGKIKPVIEDLTGVEQSASDWVTHFQILDSLLGKNAEIIFMNEDYVTLFRFKPLNDKKEIDEDWLNYVKVLLHRASTANRFMSRIGLANESLEYNDIVDDERFFLQFESLVGNPDYEWEFTLAELEPAAQEKLVGVSNSMMMGFGLLINDTIVCLAVNAIANTRLLDGKLRVKCRKCGEVRSKVVGDEVSFKRFFENTCKLWKSSMRVLPNFPK